MNEKQREKQIKILSFLALIVSVLGLSIAFAAMSLDRVCIKEPEIKWDIHFDNLSRPKITGNARVYERPFLTATHLGNLKVILTEPGDSVTYEFDIVNEGGLDAKIGFYNTSEMCYLSREHTHCDWNGNGIDDKNDLLKISENIDYTLKYKENGKDIKVGDELLKRQSKRVVLTIAYKKDATEYPSGRILLDGLDKVIQYVQLIK